MSLLTGKRQKEKVHKRMMREYLSSTGEDGDKNLEFPFISFQDIVLATGNFCDSNLLGKGGFGKVYRVQSKILSLIITPAKNVVSSAF
jgi:hypothetical protein